MPRRFSLIGLYFITIVPIFALSFVKKRLFFGLSFIIVYKAEMFYWQNTDKGTQSEIDYLTVIDGKIIPIEVKANTQGKMQSLHLFMEKHGAAYGIRTSLKNISAYTHNNRLIKVVPIYALSHCVAKCLIP